MLERLIETLIACAAFGGVLVAGMLASPDRTSLRDMAITVGGALALLALIPAVFYVLFGVTVSR